MLIMLIYWVKILIVYRICLAASNEISVEGNVEKANRTFLPPEHNAE